MSEEFLLEEFLQHMCQISEEPTEFISLKEEAYKFCKSRRCSREVDCLIYGVTLSFKTINSLPLYCSIKQKLKMAYTFQLDISNEFRQKLEELGNLEMYGSKIHGFISNDETFAVAERSPQNTIDYFLSIMDNLYTIQSFEDLVARFKEWRRKQCIWGPVDDKYLLEKFTYHLTDIIPESRNFVCLMNLVKMKNTEGTNGLLEKPIKEIMKRLDISSKLNKLEVSRSFYQEFRGRLLKIREKRGDELPVFSDLVSYDEYEGENIVLRERVSRNIRRQVQTHQSISVKRVGGKKDTLETSTSCLQAKQLVNTICKEVSKNDEPETKRRRLSMPHNHDNDLHLPAMSADLFHNTENLNSADARPRSATTEPITYTTAAESNEPEKDQTQLIANTCEKEHSMIARSISSSSTETLNSLPGVADEASRRLEQIPYGPFRSYLCEKIEKHASRIFSPIPQFRGFLEDLKRISTRQDERVHLVALSSSLHSALHDIWKRAQPKGNSENVVSCNIIFKFFKSITHEIPCKVFVDGITKRMYELPEYVISMPVALAIVNNAIRPVIDPPLTS